MRQAAERDAQAKKSQSGGAGGCGGGGEGCGGAGGAGGAGNACNAQNQQQQQQVQRADSANQAAANKWKDFQPPEAAKADPALPPEKKSKRANAVSNASDVLSGIHPPADKGASTLANAAKSANGAAAATKAAAEAKKAKDTSAPSKLDKLLDKNPSVKTNQDLVNHLYKKGGGNWEGASKEAKKAGVSLSELIRDRAGDARKTAESKRTGVDKTPGAEKPGPEKPGGVEKPSGPQGPNPPGEKAGASREIRPFRPVDEQKLKDSLPPQAKHLAKAFIEAGKKNNVDPVVLAAIAKHETGNFTSSAFKNKNNAMGISGAHGPLQQASHEASIDKMAKLLGSTTSGPYKNAKTVADIGKIYAPIGAGNDPRGLNSSWTSGVAKFADDFARRTRAEETRRAAA